MKNHLFFRSNKHLKKAAEFAENRGSFCKIVDGKVRRDGKKKKKWDVFSWAEANADDERRIVQCMGNYFHGSGVLFSVSVC